MLSDSGQYSCGNGTLLSENKALVLEVPAPVVNITSPSGIITAGGSVTLICTVELTPSVDVPVTVTTVWTGPARFMATNTSQPVAGSTTTYNSTVMLSSFERDQSGEYNCTVTISSMSSFIINSVSSSSTTRVTAGARVYLSLKGVVYPNNSVILITEIGETGTSQNPPPHPNNGLQCITDKMPCCVDESKAGEWYFPDSGGMVPIRSSATTFYRNRGGDGTVNLNRLNNNITMPTGRFCCEVADATDSIVTVCAIIVYINITDGGTTPVVGASYNLTCAVSSTEAFTSYQWRKDGAVIPDKTGPTLSFSPLNISNFGQYSCGNGTLFSNLWTLTLEVRIFIAITTSGTNTVGDNYKLKCSVTVAGSIEAPTITWLYGMTKITSNSSMTLSETSSDGSNGYSSTLTFYSLSASHAGNYSCRANVSGGMQTGTKIVTVQIPSPNVSITSNPTGLIAIGGSVTLKCTVLELSPSAGVQVTVSTEWTGPDGFMATNLSQPVMGNTTTTVVLSSFGRDQSGEYTCTATVNSMSPFIISSVLSSSTTRVTVGVYLSLNRVVYPNNSVILITDIGKSPNSGLQCVTDRMSCCSALPNRAGEWYFPSDEGIVPGPLEVPTTFYRNRGDDGTVNLNRINNVIMPTGKFCCEVPDAIDMTVTLCAIIVYINIGGDGATPGPVIGQSYKLTCAVSGSDAFTTYRWRKDGVMIPGETGPTLTLSPLRLPHAGLYSCGNGTLFSDNWALVLEVRVSVAITTSGTSTAGETYNLECSVTVAGSIETPTITWLFGMTEITSDSFTTLSETASNGSNGYFRMLTFDPLSASHAGNYSCKAAVSGEIQTGITMVTVQNTTITVRVESRVAVPVAGSTYSFNCTVTGAERLTSSTITYRWFKGGLMVADKRVKTFAFTPVSFSDAGGYTCQVTVMSDLLSVPITANSSNSINVTLILPPPSTVTVISPSRIIAGSSVNMSCIVGIPNSVKNSIPANVNAAWTVPDNVIVSPTSTKPIVGNQTNYTLSANFVRVSSGNYTCYANLRSASLFITTSRTNLGTISVDVAPLPPPTDLVIANTTAMSISLNWAQPEGAHAVDRYEISYSFVVAECVRDGVTTTDPTVTVILNEGFRRSYTISNSSATPVEEDSQYTISLRATNAIATSEKVSINMTSTLTAEPTGPPRNISIISTNSTNITIQWDEVECRERNGLILGYQVQISENVVKNTTKRNFTVSGLLPRTEYAFSVSAINNISNGSCGSVTVNTSVPLQVGFLLGGNAYGNNSIVNISDIGNNSEALHCITNRVNCCGRMDSGGIVMGEWYFPNNGSAVGTMRENGSIYRNRGPSVVRLNRRSNAMMTDGVFRCEIPDASDTNQSIYVGVYSLGKGAPTINEPLEYSCDMDEQVIICTSMGGPATNVQWWKDHKLLSVQSDQHQRIVNTSNSVYQNVLVLGQRDPDEVVGNYTCGVSNIRGEANGTILLHGIQTSVVINEDDGSMSINCTTDLAFTAIEWLDHNYHVLVNTSTEPYLEFSIVQDDEFLCRVTSSFGSQNKSLSLSLPTELSPSSAVYGAPVAVVMVLLMVTVVVVLVVLVTFKRSRKHQMRLYHVSVDISPQHKPSHSPPYESNDSLAVSLTHVSTEVDAECIELKECSEIVEGKEENTYAEDVTAVASEDLKAVPVSEFNSHVVSFHANRDKLFEREYTSISKNPQSPHIVGELPYNKNKNRFGNIFPYDTSRVKLKEIPGEEGSDYINASYVNGYNKRKAYIAAQGPMPNTVTDFWRMIWEKKLPTIVMLTRCFEGRKKCEEYWPVNVGECVEPGHGLNVTLTSLLPFAEYSVRKMTVTRPTVPNSVPLRLVHFHFTSWPDHGVPQNGVVLINFIKRVRSAHPYTDTRPLLVHCSAGVGRTGAFIVLDSMLQRMKVEENFNIFEFVIQLRAQRVLMVQTQSQYNFIHDALNEVTLCGDTEISASDLRVVVSRLSQASDGETGYSNQFNLLNQMSPATSEADYTQANMECNVSKNRYINVLPNDHYRVMLRATTVPGSDYINASFVDGYKQRGAYIASQTPLENTISDFWKMILEYRSRTIVVVNEEVSHTYLPEHIGECEVYGKVLVKVVSQQNSTDYIIRQLEIFEDKPHPQGFVPSPHPVTMFHFMCWPQYSIPQVTSTFLQLIEDVNRAQMSSGNKPITVMCNDGVGRTGTFICIHAQLERLKTEGVVDFFQSIKSARIQRAGLVSDIQQYIFCHSVVADYLDGFDTYANFKELV